MECHQKSEQAPHEDGNEKIVFVGNPNVGKSVIFGYLTGRYVTVSNYPGTTVEISTGNTRMKGHSYQVIDTPGIHSLLPMSEDERVTRDILLNENSIRVFQVCNSKNLERALPITVQLIEFGVKIGLILNMTDEAEKAGFNIKESSTSEIFGVPVVKTVAVRKKGLDKLEWLYENASQGEFKVNYGDYIEESIDKVSRVLKENGLEKSSRGIALSILCGEESLTDWIHDHFSEDEISRFNEIRETLERKMGLPLSYHVQNTRFQAIQQLMRKIQEKAVVKRHDLLDKIGNISMHPLYGVPVLLFVLYMAYLFVGKLGAGTLVDLLEGKVFNGFVNPMIVKVFDFAVPWPWVKELFVGPYGIFSMALTYSLAIILPIVGTFFIGFGIMEDSGYLPRLAVMVDRLFKLIGCNGKAVLPLILGLGCDTMATLTTRILETKKERMIITLLLALGIPCSAQLGVVLGMLASVGPFAIIVWGLFVTVIMIVVGILASFIIKGEEADFIMEIPPLRIPQMKNIFIKTLARIEWYLKEAVPLFILGTLLLFLMDKTGMLELVNRISSPVIVNLLDLPPKAAEAFIIGFLRRDYGAAGLYSMQKAGLLSGTQVMVSLITITLFVPCIANYFVIIKEQGVRITTYLMLFIFPFAIAVGATFNKVIRLLGISF
jgi:ferrous iron transport protein B